MPTPCLGQLRRLGLMSELAEEHPNVQPISERKGMVNGLNTANQMTCQFRRWKILEDGIVMLTMVRMVIRASFVAPFFKEPNPARLRPFI